MSDASAKPKTKTKMRHVGTTINADAGTVTISYDHEPIGTFDINQMPDPPPAGIVRDLAVFGASVLLARAASGDDPAEGVADMIDRLANGEWRPGRRRTESEPDPIVMALANHLGQSVDFITDTYLPRYCRAQGHVMSNGRLMLDRAKRELERHEAVAPIVAKIIAQRAKQAGTERVAIDLMAIAGSSEELDHAAE